MPRIGAMLVVVALVTTVSVGVVAFGRMSSAAVAQDDAPAALADHPVVGAWRWANDPADPIPTSYGIFHADGTYVESVGEDVGIGVWRPLGDRGIELTSYYQDVDPVAPGLQGGTITARQAYELDESGDSLSGAYAIDARTPDGGIVFQGTLQATATRLQVEPMPASAGSAATPAP